MPQLKGSCGIYFLGDDILIALWCFLCILYGFSLTMELPMFAVKWTEAAKETYERLKRDAKKVSGARKKKDKAKSSRDEGLYKQVAKTVNFLGQNPKHPGLHTHPYESFDHPWDPKQKVFEEYAQNDTSGAYRVFWCYGPGKKEITIIAITPHP
jgi:hypothetical protein